MPHYLTIQSSWYKIVSGKGDNTNTQFKKGVLELIVLYTVSKKDRYGYELVEEVSRVVDVNEGTIYPLLRRLTNERYFDTYIIESSEGPPRKYYRMTSLGEERKKELKAQWSSFERSVNQFIKRSEKDDQKTVS